MPDFTLLGLILSALVSDPTQYNERFCLPVGTSFEAQGYPAWRVQLAIAHLQIISYCTKVAKKTPTTPIPGRPLCPSDRAPVWSTLVCVPRREG